MRHLFLYSALIMVRFKFFVFVVMSVSCGLAFSQAAGVTEEKAIMEACPERIAMKDSTGNGIRVPVGQRYDLQSHSVKRCLTVAEAKPAIDEEMAIMEACPERIAMKDSTGNGIRVPVGHRYDLQSHNVKRCLTVTEAKPAIDEEKAIMEACPERIAMKDSAGNGIRIPVGHRYDLQSHSIKRCLTVAEGESTAAEKKLPQVSSKQAISETQHVSGSGGQAQSSTPPTYQDVLTTQELAWSNSLPYAHRATTQFSPAQIASIKQDGRWEPWVALTKAEVAGQKKSTNTNHQASSGSGQDIAQRVIGNGDGAGQAAAQRAIKGSAKTGVSVIETPAPVHIATYCGSKWYQRLGLQLLEMEQSIKGGYSFDAACQIHDACYGDCRTRKTDCDKKLLTYADAVCQSARNQGNCIADAQIFYQKVSEKGDIPFRQARANCPSSK